MRQDDLIGLKITAKTPGRKAYVAQCDPEIGLTIHDWETDKELICLNRKEFFAFMKRFVLPDPLSLWNQWFLLHIEHILGGYVPGLSISIVPGNIYVHESTEFGIGAGCAFK